MTDSAADNTSTIRETMATILAEVRGINRQLSNMSGRLEVHDTLLAAHSIKLALLDQSQAGDKGNWDKVWDLLKPALVAVLVAVVMTILK
jgi:hypothetical protein